MLFNIGLKGDLSINLLKYGFVPMLNNIGLKVADFLNYRNYQKVSYMENYDVYSIPLKTHLFKESDIKRKRTSHTDGSSLLMFEKVRHENENMKVRAASSMLESQFSSVLEGSGYLPIETIEKEAEQKIKNKGLFRKIKPKIEDFIFDYSEEELSELEKKVADIINKDGYYNEVKPYDSGTYEKDESTIDGRIILLVVGILALIPITYLYLKFFW